LYQTIRMKHLVIGILFIVGLTACSGSHVKKINRIMQYSCSNDFSLSFEERTTVTDKDSTTKISVLVKSKSFTKELEMNPVKSGSGAKYATKDGNYFYWEHQGEVSFGTEDSTYCLCK
jgi:membrane-bound inhibitor of C-type lysozyme